MPPWTTGWASRRARTRRSSTSSWRRLAATYDHAGAPRLDLVLLDLNLPGRLGREVLADIKGDPELRRIPLVVLTASKAEVTGVGRAAGDVDGSTRSPTRTIPA